MADDAEAVDEELPDLEVIEEKTETSTTSAPQDLFFIDKGKPKVIIRSENYYLPQNIITAYWNIKGLNFKVLKICFLP